MLNGIFEVPEDYIENSDGTGTPVYKASNRVRVQFEQSFVLNEGKTLETGKEVFDETLIVLMQAKGDSNVVSHRANEQHKAMFPAQWKRFKDGQSGEVGNSLSNLYGVGPNLIAAFAARGIFSIQNLLKAEPGLISDIPGAEKVLALAQVWTSSRDGEGKAAVLIAEATTYRARAEKAEEELSRLKAKLKAPKARRKRPLQA